MTGPKNVDSDSSTTLKFGAERRVDRSRRCLAKLTTQRNAHRGGTTPSCFGLRNAGQITADCNGNGRAACACSRPPSRFPRYSGSAGGASLGSDPSGSLTLTDSDRSNGVIWAGGARKDELKVIADDVSMMMIERDVSMREVLSWTWREQGSAWRHRHAARRDVDSRSGRCCALNCRQEAAEVRDHFTSYLWCDVV